MGGKGDGAAAVNSVARARSLSAVVAPWRARAAGLMRAFQIERGASRRRALLHRRLLQRRSSRRSSVTRDQPLGVGVGRVAALPGSRSRNEKDSMRLEIPNARLNRPNTSARA